MKITSSIILNSGKTYNIKTNLPERLHELVIIRFNQSSDRQLIKLRTNTLSNVLNTNDKLIDEETQTTTHALSLLWLKRELDEYVTFNNGHITFEIASNGLKFYVKNRIVEPVGSFATPFDEFVDVAFQYECKKSDLYEAYFTHCMMKQTPAMSKIAFGKALKVYFPQLVYGRYSDLKRTHYISGIRVKEG
jgi:hypothetical protein